MVKKNPRIIIEMLESYSRRSKIEKATKILNKEDPKKYKRLFGRYTEYKKPECSREFDENGDMICQIFVSNGKVRSHTTFSHLEPIENVKIILEKTYFGQSPDVQTVYIIDKEKDIEIQIEMSIDGLSEFTIRTLDSDGEVDEEEYFIDVEPYPDLLDEYLSDS